MSQALFQLEDAGGDTVNIRNVPCFKVHDDRDYDCDREWLDRCVADFIAQKAEAAAIGGEDYAMLPPITIGHTPEDPNDAEPPAVGFVDNLRRRGDVLYCDFVDVQREAWERMQRNEFPYRSAEIVPNKHRLTNVSLLGGRYPHFALPVMRFAAELCGETVDVIRYTLRGPNMANRSNSVTNIQRHGLGETAGGHANGAGGMDINALAAALAPAVAKLLAAGQANAQGGPTANAGAYKEEGVERHDKMFSLEKHGEEDDPDKTQKGAQAGFESQTTKLTPAANAAKTTDSAAEANDGKGKADTLEKERNSAATEKRYAAEVEALRKQNDELRASIGELQRHNAAQGEAAKRSMLRSKVKEVAALGYALGDSERIEKHVNLMMRFNNEEIVDYIDNTLKSFPKVSTATQRHGTSDGIRRPGSETETQRYYADNADELKAVGIDHHAILDLADVLS